MSNKFRLSSGGQISKDEKISFKFNGKIFFGFRGDTLASALLANGIHLIGRSFKYHRPRGILSSGAEEPNALVQVIKDKANQLQFLSTNTNCKDSIILFKFSG